MHEAAAIGAPSILTALASAEAMSRCEPAMVPSAALQTPSRTWIRLPCSMNASEGLPTDGIASVTSISRSGGLQHNAILSVVGLT